MRIENAGNCGYIDSSIAIPGTSLSLANLILVSPVHLMLKQHAGCKLAEGILLHEHCLQYLPLTTFPLLDHCNLTLSPKGKPNFHTYPHGHQYALHDIIFHKPTSKLRHILETLPLECRWTHSTPIRDIYVFGHLRGVVGLAEQFAKYVHDLVEDRGLKCGRCGKCMGAQ